MMKAILMRAWRSEQMRWRGMAWECCKRAYRLMAGLRTGAREDVGEGELGEVVDLEVGVGEIELSRDGVGDGDREEAGGAGGGDAVGGIFQGDGFVGGDLKGGQGGEIGGGVGLVAGGVFLANQSLEIVAEVA